jgi:hypothetical protein
MLFSALPCRPRVGLMYASPRRDADVVVDDPCDGGGRNAGSIVRDDDARRLAARDRDLNVRRDLRFLAGVNGVIA